MYVVLHYCQQKLSLLQIYACVPWCLTAISAFQIEMHFRGSEFFSGKLIAAGTWHSGACRPAPGAPAAPGSFLWNSAVRGEEPGVLEEEGKGMVGGGGGRLFLSGTFPPLLALYAGR